MRLEVRLDAWALDEGEVPVVAAGQEAELRLLLYTSTIDRRGVRPPGVRFEDDPSSLYLSGTVTWVGEGDGELQFVIEHHGAQIAIVPAHGWVLRRPVWWQRLRHRGLFPLFVPMELPVPSVGQVVEVEGELTVMPDKHAEFDWHGPDVTMRYEVNQIDAEVYGPSPLRPGRHNFEPVDFPSRPPVIGLSASLPPPGYDGDYFDLERDSVSAYRLLLTPIP